MIELIYVQLKRHAVALSDSHHNRCHMIRKNPRGDLPDVHESAFVDPTAILCGCVIVEAGVLLVRMQSSVRMRLRLRETLIQFVLVLVPTSRMGW